MGLISRVSSRTYRSQKKTTVMVFNKFVEVGRVVFIPSSGKIACIVDVADFRHVLIDGPSIDRQKINLNRIQLTKFSVEGLFHGARTKTVSKAWSASNVDAQWKESAWAKKIVQKEARRNLNDFQRFKVMKLKQQRARIINRAVNKAKQTNE